MIPDSQPNMIDLSAASIDYIDTGGDGPPWCSCTEC